MSPDASSEGLKQAVIQSVELGAYPESEDVVAAELPASVLPALLSDLQKARDQVKVWVVPCLSTIQDSNIYFLG